MSQLHGLIDLDAQSEVVRGDDNLSKWFAKAKPLLGSKGQSPLPSLQAACRSLRNWKNSTPSRRRRFIICGLRTISPTMEAIFGARK